MAGVASVFVVTLCHLAGDSLVSLISIIAWTLWRARWLAPKGEESGKDGRKRDAWMSDHPKTPWLISGLPMIHWTDCYYLPSLWDWLDFVCFSFDFSVVTRGWTQDLRHAGQGLCHWAIYFSSVSSLNKDIEKGWKWSELSCNHLHPQVQHSSSHPCVYSPDHFCCRKHASKRYYLCLFVCLHK